MIESDQEKELMDYLEVLWRKKWLIIIPTILCAVIIGIWSYSLPYIWEINLIIQPGKFVIQNEGGRFEEVMTADPKQIAGQINQDTYNDLIAAEFKLNIKDMPKFNAKKLGDTNLVKVSIIGKDIQKAKAILRALFTFVKRDLDKKIDVEIKSLDSQITRNENTIIGKNLDIQSKEIEKLTSKKDVSILQNKLTISEERARSLIEEMKSFKDRIDDFDERQKKALAEKKEGSEILGLFLLLYSNEIQQNLRYYGTLDEKLSGEKVSQENIRSTMNDKETNIKQIDTQIDKMKNEIDVIKNQISILNEKKARIDFTLLSKEPTSSGSPVAPSRKRNVIIAGLLALVAFTFLAFFIEYIERYKTQRRA